MYKHNDIKNLKTRIDNLKDLRLYITSKYRKKVIENKIRDLQKELKLIYRK